MTYDAKNLFSADQVVTTTAASTNELDLGTGYDARGVARIRDIGQGKELHVHIHVTEAVTASGSATVTFALRGAAAENMGSAVVLATTPAIAKASLTLGKKIQLMIPPENQYRYLDLYYTVATGPLITGKFTAWVGGPA